jgi:hypothetical protein
MRALIVRACEGSNDFRERNEQQACDNHRSANRTNPILFRDQGEQHDATGNETERSNTIQNCGYYRIMRAVSLHLDFA